MVKNNQIIEDKQYCMESFLQFRFIEDRNKTFKSGVIPTNFQSDAPFYHIKNSEDLENSLRDYINDLFSEKQGETALMLSGGIDSAVLAALVPEGTKCYTFRSNIPGTADESPFAKEYAEANGLDHEVIDIDWQDFVDYTPKLMHRKGAPIHSISVQIYKAASVAREAGFTNVVFGESADLLFGGQDGLFGTRRSMEEFASRYSYVDPSKVLKEGQMLYEPFERHTVDGIVNTQKFARDIYYRESSDSYDVSCSEAGVHFRSPFSKMIVDVELDIDRIASGDNKYFIREVYNRLYPDAQPRKKTPMTRAVDEYMKDWSGPKRPEFLNDIDISDFSGDQKWYIFCLEWYLNMIDNVEPSMPSIAS